MHGTIQDFWNPNTWDLSSPEYRIYGNNDCTIWAVVDEEDYQWASQWMWSCMVSRHGLIYLRRTLTITENGKRRYEPFYLHVGVMQRTGIEPESPKHVLVDHKDRDTLNCRRINLRWATYKMNANNRKKRRTSGRRDVRVA
jgi:hypothetical protein